MKPLQQIDETVMKPYSIGELAIIYGVSIQVMHRWLGKLQNELGEKRGRFYTTKQVTLVFEKLGLPQMVHPKEFEIVR